MKNIKNNLLKITLAAFTISTTACSSNHNYTYQNDTTTGFEKYKVISSTPITKQITKRIRVGDDLKDKIIHKRVPCPNQQEVNSIGFDTIIGTVAGIAIGNQIGKGNGRDVAKIIGGLGGGYVANQMRNSNNNCYEQVVVQESTPRYENITQEITTGYNNCVNMDGKKICKESKDKRDYLKIKKTYTVY